jgi:hypothetical protein
MAPLIAAFPLRSLALRALAQQGVNAQACVEQAMSRYRLQ